MHSWSTQIRFKESSSSIINELADIGGSGGLIAIDSKGNISTPFINKGMIRGSQTNKMELSSKFIKDL